MTACAAPPAMPGPTTTVTATPPPSVVVFNPQTSGKDLAERIKARAKPKDPGITISGVECKNFRDIKVNTHTDCQMVVNGVKRGYRATSPSVTVITKSRHRTLPGRRRGVRHNGFPVVVRVNPGREVLQRHEAVVIAIPQLLLLRLAHAGNSMRAL